jgi:hypothetical protein
MSNAENPAPAPDPKKQQNPETQRPSTGPDPSKPGNDPDQTPEREVKNPPVADPKKQDKPGKIGLNTDQYLLF